jgi:hypothetical protein
MSCLVVDNALLHASCAAKRQVNFPAADPALTSFPFDGCDMTNDIAAQARLLFKDFTQTIGSRSTRYNAYLEFCGHAGRAIVPVNEGQMVVYWDGWQ